MFTSRPEEGDQLLAVQRAQLTAQTESTACMSLSGSEQDSDSDSDIIKTGGVLCEALQQQVANDSVASSLGGQEDVDQDDRVLVEELSKTVVIVSGKKKYPIDVSDEKLKNTPLESGKVVESSAHIDVKVPQVRPKFIGDQDDDTSVRSPFQGSSPPIPSQDFSPGSAPGAFRNLTVSTPERGSGLGDHGSHYSACPSSEETGIGSGQHAGGTTLCGGTHTHTHAFAQRAVLGHSGEMAPETRKQHPELFDLLSKTKTTVQASASCVPRQYSTAGGFRIIVTTLKCLTIAVTVFVHGILIS